MEDLCNQCGACCRVLTLEQSPEEVRATAALTKVLGIPSDAVFAAEHWHSLTRAEAMKRNPYYTQHLPPDAHLYTCDQLGSDGRCLAYDNRPLVCRGYPWYEQPVRDMQLADPNCGYSYDVVMEYVVRRPDL
jgi:Fe-S-cluster containining protein